MAVSVILDFAALDAADAIRQLVNSVTASPGVADATQLLTDIYAREVVLPTYVGEGVALPHARTDAVKLRVVAVACSPAGVPFGPKGELAYIIVLVGCPRNEVNAYLAFTKKLLRRLRVPQVRAELMATKDPVKFIELLELGDDAPAAP
jgi:mannitol/fructose-specific phosphotransferase system IIA component (Ntr-type)